MIIGQPFYDGIGRVTEFWWFVTESVSRPPRDLCVTEFRGFVAGSVWRVFEEWCVTEFRWSVTESVSLCDRIRVVV